MSFSDKKTILFGMMEFDFFIKLYKKCRKLNVEIQFVEPNSYDLIFEFGDLIFIDTVYLGYAWNYYLEGWDSIYHLRDEILNNHQDWIDQTPIVILTDNKKLRSDTISKRILKSENNIFVYDKMDFYASEKQIINYIDTILYPRKVE